MRKLLANIGIALCLVGVLLGSFAIAAYLMPPGDPAGAAGTYDKGVEAYNERLNEIAESNPELPAMKQGRTLLQAHKEDTLFWILAAGAIILTGLALYLATRSTQDVARK